MTKVYIYSHNKLTEVTDVSIDIVRLALAMNGGIIVTAAGPGEAKRKAEAK